MKNIIIALLVLFMFPTTAYCKNFVVVKSGKVVVDLDSVRYLEKLQDDGFHYKILVMFNKPSSFNDDFTIIEYGHEEKIRDADFYKLRKYMKVK